MFSGCASNAKLNKRWNMQCNRVTNCYMILCFQFQGTEWYIHHIIRGHNLSRDVTKPTKWVCAQRRLRSAWASAQSDQSSLSAWRKLGSLATHRAHREDSDQTGQMPSLIRAFAGRTVALLVLSCRGSYSLYKCFFLSSWNIICVFIIIKWTFIWATSWENLFMPYANNKGADQPVHPRSLISTFIICCLDSL